jgi:hypothetical protein
MSDPVGVISEAFSFDMRDTALGDPERCSNFTLWSIVCNNQGARLLGHFRGRLISCLFFGCGPAAITRFIVAVSVFAVDRMTFWPLSHVCEKIFKYQPPLGHGNTLRTVMLPIFGFWHCRSVDHAAPRPPCRRGRQAVLVAIRPAMTTAGDISSTSQRSSPYRPFLATIAAAKPHGLADTTVCSSASNEQLTKSLIGQIEHLHDWSMP